tara:strand:- start:44 stop:586 length:543 start_codon:yes stop_codon:yes gene_type:complete
MPPWFSHICSYQRIESNSPSSSWVQLATLGIDNKPKVRTVVFRDWSDLYEMIIFTDIRSQKYNEIKANKSSEICWFFRKSNCQFRFSGSAKIDLGNDRDHYWEKLSENSKSMWGWPNPGDHFENDQISYLRNKQNYNQFDNFSLLKINITHVEQLILEVPIHKRRRWIRKNEWIEEQINP